MVTVPTTGSVFTMVTVSEAVSSPPSASVAVTVQVTLSVGLVLVGLNVRVDWLRNTSFRSAVGPRA